MSITTRAESNIKGSRRRDRDGVSDEPTSTVVG